MAGAEAAASEHFGVFFLYFLCAFVEVKAMQRKNIKNCLYKISFLTRLQKMREKKRNVHVIGSQ